MTLVIMLTELMSTHRPGIVGFQNFSLGVHTKIATIVMAV